MSKKNNKLFIKITWPKEWNKDSYWGRNDKMNYLIWNTYEVIWTMYDEYIRALIRNETSKDPEGRRALNNQQFILWKESDVKNNKPFTF